MSRIAIIFGLVLALLGFGATCVWLVRRNNALRTAYEQIASDFEDPFLAIGPHPAHDFDGNMFGRNTDLPDGRRQIEWGHGWRSVGPVQGDLDSGGWSILSPDGSVRARFEMRDGQREGPCEFQDAIGARRVHGQFHADHRVGVWTLENVLGAGTTRVYFGR